MLSLFWKKIFANTFSKITVTPKFIDNQNKNWEYCCRKKHWFHFRIPQATVQDSYPDDVKTNSSYICHLSVELNVNFLFNRCEQPVIALRGTSIFLTMLYVPYNRKNNSKNYFLWSCWIILYHTTSSFDPLEVSWFQNCEK